VRSRPEFEWTTQAGRRITSTGLALFVVFEYLPPGTKVRNLAGLTPILKHSSVFSVTEWNGLMQPRHEGVRISKRDARRESEPDGAAKRIEEAAETPSPWTTRHSDSG
jgi:hypothetical protein